MARNLPHQLHRHFNLRNLLCSLGLLTVICIVTTPLLGQVSGTSDPYQITPNAGAWMICVSSYAGETSQKLAHELVQELRDRYHLQAYVFNRGAEEREKQLKESEERKQRQKEFFEKNGLTPDMPARMRKVRIEDQYAVLVGGYKDIDAARKALDKIKKLDPPKTVPQDSIGMAKLDPSDKEKQKGKIERVFVNPFRTSFVVHNPTVPMEKAQAGPDPNLKAYNSGESYSLLQCPKPWTLVVKDFMTGSVQPQNTPVTLLDKLTGRNGPSLLDANTKQAHEIARVLREMQFESYVLHTRYGSILCVGAYDSKDDPRLLQNARVFAKMQLNSQAGPSISFFAQPLPMEVPRP